MIPINHDHLFGVIVRTLHVIGPAHKPRRHPRPPWSGRRLPTFEESLAWSLKEYRAIWEELAKL